MYLFLLARDFLPQLEPEPMDIKPEINFEELQEKWYIQLIW